MSIESVMLCNHLILCYPFLCFQLFPASESFPMSQLIASDGKSIGASTSATVLPVNTEGYFLLGLTSLISLLSKDSQSLLQHHKLKASVLWHSAFFMVQLSHLYMTTGKTIALTIQSLFGRVMSLVFNTLSRFVIAFLSKEQASFNFMTAVTVCSDFGAQENKDCHCFHYFPICLS